MASNKNCQDLNRKPSNNLINGYSSGQKGDVVFRWINGRIVALKAEYADNFPSETQQRNAEFFQALHEESAQLVALLNASEYAKELGIKYSLQCLAKYNMKRKDLVKKIGFVWYTTPDFTEPVLDLIDLLEDAGNITMTFSNKVKDAIWNNAEINAIGTSSEDETQYGKLFGITYKKDKLTYGFVLEKSIKKIAYWTYSLRVGQGWKTVAIQRSDFINVRHK